MKKIPDDILKEICKMGQGADCCRYIIVDPEHGIVCARWTKWEIAIDMNIDNMVAQGENCEGILLKEGSQTE